VDDVEVDLVDAQPSEAVLDLGDGVLPGGVELGRDEELLAQVHRIFEVMNVDTLVAMHESLPVAIASLPAVRAANGSANADAA
jgi:hypothetical protein